MMISETGSQGRKRCGMMMDGQGGLGRFGNFDSDDDAVFLLVFHGMEEEPSQLSNTVCGSVPPLLTTP